MISRRALAHAPSYIVLNRRTAAAELVCGGQVDYVLSEIYEDDQVEPLNGGAFAVTRAYPVKVGEAHEVVQYLPLHRDQRLHQHVRPDSTYAMKRSQEGRTFIDMPNGSGKDLLRFVQRHEGAFYRTVDDHILRLHKRRILGIWQPVMAEAFAQAA
ncbi:hypothetical protein QFZ75_008053 [Streptomyces sp. V3I8]|uniref:hypothetical protein n=1 Tax=Streptomyces sp. V3I8 TaxID=3042279 RepID=UPI0027850D42|nr:hypothetical protein [Streptomyces sp. V3I8]MDQ1041551.1 hypothetical protein [Streptomyces sp. V3I8]